MGIDISYTRDVGDCKLELNVGVMPEITETRVTTKTRKDADNIVVGDNDDDGDDENDDYNHNNLNGCDYDGDKED